MGGKEDGVIEEEAMVKGRGFICKKRWYWEAKVVVMQGVVGRQRSLGARGSWAAQEMHQDGEEEKGKVDGENTM